MGWICAVTHILSRWKHHFCQFLNVPGVNDARQNVIHKTELLMPKYSTLEVEMSNEEKIYEAASSDHIPSECSKQEAEQCILRFINVILFGIRNNCIDNTRINHFTYIRRVIKMIVVIIEAYHLSRAQKIQHSSIKVNWICR